MSFPIEAHLTFPQIIATVWVRLRLYHVARFANFLVA